MKTTIDLSDSLFVAAKERAAEEKRTLRSLVEEGLRAVLGRKHQVGHRRARIRWVTCKGGLPKGIDLSDRSAMHAWIEQDRARR